MKTGIKGIYMKAVFCRLARGAAGALLGVGIIATAVNAQTGGQPPGVKNPTLPETMSNRPVSTGFGQADKKQLAPDFKTRSPSSRLVILPVDMELFSLSAGGVTEPKADWTELAQKNFKLGLGARKQHLGAVVDLKEAEYDEMAELSALHGALAHSIFLHHMQPMLGVLPTKDGKLDWSMGDAVQDLKQKSGADYALFTWVRDSYASAERKATMVVMAMLGVGIVGGTQVGYASLVDLNTGRVVWFNALARVTGDLREAASAQETVDELLKGFPKAE